jgi:hypothetical protein
VSYSIGEKPKVEVAGAAESPKFGGERVRQKSFHPDILPITLILFPTITGPHFEQISTQNIF